MANTSKEILPTISDIKLHKNKCTVCNFKLKWKKNLCYLSKQTLYVCIPTIIDEITVIYWFINLSINDLIMMSILNTKMYLEFVAFTVQCSRIYMVCFYML